MYKESDTWLTSKTEEEIPFGVIPAQSEQQAWMQKLSVELVSDFSRQDHIQIMYKPPLVYYLHETFLFNQVNCFSRNGTISAG